jgi:hypothetical protein
MRNLDSEITGWADCFASGYNAAINGLPESSIDRETCTTEDTYQALLAGYSRGKEAVQVREAFALAYGYMKASIRMVTS